jgi:hypothetical protein
MKKEIAAAALLITLITASLFNILYLDRFVGGLTDALELSRRSMEAGDFYDAEASLRAAIDTWMAADGYTHIFIRHSEINSTTDAFYETLGDVVSHDTESAEGSFGKLNAQLTSITGIEHLRFGSIF